MMLMKQMKPLAICLSLMACAPLAEEQTCDPAKITQAGSALGMNYAKMAPSPVAEILSQGEAEYLQDDYLVSSGAIRENQKKRVWRRQVRALLKSKLPENREDFAQPNMLFFRLTTPKMFQALRRCVDPNDPVLGYIPALPKFPATVELNY